MYKTLYMNMARVNTDLNIKVSEIFLASDMTDNLIAFAPATKKQTNKCHTRYKHIYVHLPLKKSNKTCSK